MPGLCQALNTQTHWFFISYVSIYLTFYTFQIKFFSPKAKQIQREAASGEKGGEENKGWKVGVRSEWAELHTAKFLPFSPAPFPPLSSVSLPHPWQLQSSCPSPRNPLCNRDKQGQTFLFYLEGRETGKETSMCGYLSSPPPTGHLACTPGMCPDWE